MLAKSGKTCVEFGPGPTRGAEGYSDRKEYCITDPTLCGTRQRALTILFRDVPRFAFGAESAWFRTAQRCRSSLRKSSSHFSVSPYVPSAARPLVRPAIRRNFRTWSNLPNSYRSLPKLDENGHAPASPSQIRFIFSSGLAKATLDLHKQFKLQTKTRSSGRNALPLLGARPTLVGARPGLAETSLSWSTAKQNWLTHTPALVEPIEQRSTPLSRFGRERDNKRLVEPRPDMGTKLEFDRDRPQPSRKSES